MALLPALQARERIVLALRAADLDQRMLRRASSGGLHPGGLARLLLVVRRPGRVAEPLLFEQLEQRFERSRPIVDSLVEVAQLPEAPGHRREREVSRL